MKNNEKTQLRLSNSASLISSSQSPTTSKQQTRERRQQSIVSYHGFSSSMHLNMHDVLPEVHFGVSAIGHHCQVAIMGRKRIDQFAKHRYKRATDCFIVMAQTRAKTREKDR